MQDMICRAIREKRLLEVIYHGHARTVAPHIYGVDTTGEELLSCYQIAGSAAGGEQVGWKSLKLRELAVMNMSAKRFRPRSEFQQGDRAMARIFCQV